MPPSYTAGSAGGAAQAAALAFPLIRIRMTRAGAAVASDVGGARRAAARKRRGRSKRGSGASPLAILATVCRPLVLWSVCVMDARWRVVKNATGLHRSGASA
jgi:hypothetical protein